MQVGGVKRDRMNMSLLDAAYADSRDSIQLEAAYKARPATRTNLLATRAD